MTSYLNRLKTSNDVWARALRAAYYALRGFSLPVPRALALPISRIVLGLGMIWRDAWRILVCEPYLKARCEAHGRDVHTGSFLHYIRGDGRIVLGDRVRMDGKSSLMFASVLPESPILTIGDDTYVNHNATLIIARQITIGKKVLIGPNVTIFDSPGHPLDPARRHAGLPPAPDDIRAVSIEDGAWICSGACVFPGVTIGRNSVVGMNAIVTRDVPPNTVVAGAPARVVRTL